LVFNIFWNGWGFDFGDFGGFGGFGGNNQAPPAPPANPAPAGGNPWGGNGNPWGPPPAGNNNPWGGWNPAPAPAGGNPWGGNMWAPPAGKLLQLHGLQVLMLLLIPLLNHLLLNQLLTRLNVQVCGLNVVVMVSMVQNVVNKDPVLLLMIGSLFANRFNENRLKINIYYFKKIFFF